MTIDKKKTNEELIAEAKSFFETYKKEIGESIRKGRKVIFVNFDDLSSSSPLLAEALIGNPIEILQILETALEDTGLIKGPRIRFSTLPETQKVKIRTIRAQHLNQLIFFEGIIRQASDVRPQVVNAKFECPSCGTVISVLQIEKKFREPTRCSCGRKGQFRLISKIMVDAQRLVVEEAPESLSGGEQPRRMTVFLKEDLVEPIMEEKTTPGSKIRVLGILNEVPLPLPTGSISTRFDLAIEANNIIPLESTYEDLDISEEDERQIEELATDPELFKKLRESIAPSIWGYEEIKEALVLQMFGGVRKVSPDGTVSRGDMHVFLIGDPGVAKSIGKNEKILYISKDNNGIDTIENLYKRYRKFPENLKVLTINQKDHKPEWENVYEIIKHLPEKNLIKVTTEHGKSILATLDHSFITLSKNGEIIPIKGNELNNNSYLPLPINYHKEMFQYFYPGFFNKKHSNNSKILPDKIKLDNDFGFFVGIFLAEGCIGANKTIMISNKNKEIQEKIIKFSKKIGLNFNTDNKRVCIFSKNLSDILKVYCYNQTGLKNISSKVKGNYSRIKKIPGFAFFSPKNFINGLLSGLFSGDGRLIQDKKMLKGFELITISKDLAEDTSDLLFSIGIINKIKGRNYLYKNNKTDYYSLSIPTSMIKSFTENIEIIGRELKINKKDPIYSYKNLIPCGDLVYRVVKKLGYCSRKTGDRTLAAEMRTVKKRGEIGRLRLLRLIKEFEIRSKEKIEELEILKKIANSNIIWSKINSIDALNKKNEDVYDLSIPTTNTFVANGIGVHNSLTLKFISNIAPRGRYIVGKSASGAGITATVVKDEFLKGWALEAGAMVLANNGIVCLHPESQIISNNKIIPIKELFNEKESKAVISHGEKVEIFDLSLKTPSLLGDNLNIGLQEATMIRRKEYNGKLLKIKLDSGFSLILTPEHKLIDGNSLKWKEAKEFKKNDFLFSPLKLPSNESELYILDMLPDNWIVSLNSAEKQELKNFIIPKYKLLSNFNKKYGLSRHYLSAGKQFKINTFKQILNEFGLYDSWKKRELKYSRSKAGELLRISKITPPLAYFIGFTYGDGHIKVNKRRSMLQITQSTKNYKQINKIKEFFKEFSYRKLGEYQRTSNSIIRGKSVKSEHVILYTNSNLIAFLSKFFIKESLSNILLMNNECIKAFIAGCLDSDGCISIKNCTKNNKNYQIAHIEFLLSNDERANKNFMLALRRLDCYSKFIIKKPINLVRTTGREDIITFLKEVAHYSIKIKEIPEMKKIISSTSSKLPIEPVSIICSKIIKNCQAKQELNNIGLSSILYKYKNKKLQPSRGQLTKINNKLNLTPEIKNEIEILLQRDFFIDKIISITEENYKGYVYDLFIPNTHNFVCEGTIVHNCIDEIEKMDPQDRSAMHEALEQQCYLPDFEIMLSDGLKVKIGEFVEELMKKNKDKIQKGFNCEILPLNEKIEILTTDFESIYPVRINKVSKYIAPNNFIKICLASGRKITVTPEHPCWTIKDGKITTIPAHNITNKDFFPIPGELPIEGEKKIFNDQYKNCPDLCSILGYHITDGCYELNRGIKNGIQFWNNDKKLIDDYTNCIKNYFNINPGLTKRNNQFAVRVVSKKVVEFLTGLDKNLLEKGKFKIIPEKMMNCKKEDVAFLLRALFDGDGTVVNVKRGGCRVSLITENIKLAEQVSELLLRFSILSSVYKDREFFKLDICGQENLAKFFAYIGFLSEKKQNRLKIYLEKNKTFRSITDIIPNTTITIKKIFKKLRINEEKYLGNQVCMNCEKHRLFLQKMINICEEKIKRLNQAKEIIKNTENADELKKARELSELSILHISQKIGITGYMLNQYEQKGDINNKYKKILSEEIQNMLIILPELKILKKLAFGKIRWSKIKSVEILENKDIKWVYDIMIEPTNSFISNNMVLHNSVTISKANVQACYSQDTEVLTEKGWKKYNKVKNNKIAQYNPKDKTIEFLPHKGLFVYDYNNKMYNFINKRNNILVTPNHKMLIKPDDKNSVFNYELITAEKIDYANFYVYNCEYGKNKFIINKSKIKKEEIKKTDYNGKVFCFSTDTGFFITRRNGKIAIQGNTLSARTSVLAAGNPKFGRFEPSQSITEQIDLPPTLLNRFDLIFILRDLPNKAQDDAIATHVLNIHQRKDKKPDITIDLFKKYVAYAKRKIEPKLTEEAVEEIKNFYVKLRNLQTSGDSKSIPISARQLQGLVRLAEAHAKSRLSSTVEKKDAEVSIKLTTYYLMQVGYDPQTKKFDIDRFTTRISSSQRSKLILLRETIKKLEEVHGKQIPMEILRQELGSNISDAEFEETIEKLEKEGQIFHPKHGFVQEIGSR